MIETAAFKTRARTIDHLGREQIADCPTAVSELWKNAYDAYAREVALHIFDGEMPIAAIVDDGHGMSREDFIEKWLVVGTESKTSSAALDVSDRNQLPIRPKQGQKGIGRLSSANLGSLLLLVSKKTTQPFVATLVDWRLFENPFLYLQDIEIPIIEFYDPNELLEQLPKMFDRLMGNLWGDGRDFARDQRIKAAWQSFDELEENENKQLTSKAIETVLIATVFEPRHLQQWNVWNGKKTHGTALFIGNISFDLEAQLKNQTTFDEEETAKKAQDRLFETLQNFTDPFVDASEILQGYAAEDFDVSVTAWEGLLSRPIISSDREFDLCNLEELEHILDGTVDELGIFKGRIKAFGQWLEGEIQIIPKAKVPTRSDSRVGLFRIRLGSYEGLEMNSTHPAEVWSKFKGQSERYGGLLIYRNGLRVMPYGREDNDFFEIEKRRSQHAGREFWSNRRTFGRIALTRSHNPNLRDKAGREGIIDNKASKVFRDLVENILIASANRFFGTKALHRKESLRLTQESNAKLKANEAQKKVKARKRKEFRKNLQDFTVKLQQSLYALRQLADQARIGFPDDEYEVLAFRERLSGLKNEVRELSLGQPPSSLGILEEPYKAFRRDSREVAELCVQLNDTVTKKLETLKPKSSTEIAYSNLNRNAAFLHNRLRKWNAQAAELLNAELKRVSQLTEERNKSYHLEMLPLLDDLEHQRISLAQTLDEFDRERDRQDSKNAEVFEPYISVLKSLQESVDVEALISFTLEESANLNKKLDELNALAQLGITVEFIGHEIEGLDMTMSRGLREMPESIKTTSAYLAVKTAHESLADRLRFLSPLKLSGEKIKTWLTGDKLLDYIQGFMGSNLADRKIILEATPSFRRFSVYEQPARIYPVFINLVNNAAYWVSQSDAEPKTILLDIADGKVIVADNGPGVEEDDLKHLFSLFFTRKLRGGRGVGLYLCRANLAVGGHTIDYIQDGNLKKLPGANFMIDFKGAKYE
ncbi:ATP-binding protein [Methylovulum miyakonense]|uniref:ATP-binding protein n=1 Tax=Methylovulum miyakonense TaxID=645578 RepID=UPI000367B656|nr:ATP-binding protein [Methylovulum miyakonense]